MEEVRPLALMLFFRLPTVLAVGFCIAAPLAAQSVTCPGSRITVQNAEDRAKAICKAAAEATEQLASCNLNVAHPVTIEITDTLPDNCYGLYHCDDQLIQLRPLEHYAKDPLSIPDGPFGHLGPEAFFNSVLRHELAHAAMGATPCPFEACPVTREFVAYSMQIWFLSDVDRAPFDKSATEARRPMTLDGVNALALMMAREAFIENAHAYLYQQDDPCALIGAIASGEVVLDPPFR